MEIIDHITEVTPVAGEIVSAVPGTGRCEVWVIEVKKCRSVLMAGFFRKPYASGVFVYILDNIPFI